jgi:hypothetical protein
MIRIDEKLELDETALALLDTTGAPDSACMLMGDVLDIIPAPENEWSSWSSSTQTKLLLLEFTFDMTLSSSSPQSCDGLEVL